MSTMRVLAIAAAVLCCAAPAAAPAAASVPRFGIFDLHDLAQASKNEYGDVKATPRQPKATFVVSCRTGCRLGRGWLAFNRDVGPAAGEIRSASAAPGRMGWSLRLRLTPDGQSHWLAYARVAAVRAKQTGVPDVLAVAVGGKVLAAPLANSVRLAKGRLDVPGFTRAEARAAATSLG